MAQTLIVSTVSDDAAFVHDGETLKEIFDV
jgi:hypothetical protein